MGLLTILKKVKTKEKEVRILILGLDNAGKTTILRKFSAYKLPITFFCNHTIKGEPTDTVEPTLGFNIKTVEHRSYKLNIWDVGGQRTIRAYWRNYFESTDGLVWVIDSSDRMRMEQCRDELYSLLQQEKLSGASLLILANKQDLFDAMSAEEIVSALGLRTHDAFSGRHWSIYACSAVEGEGLVEGIDWLVNDIANRIFMLN